MMRAHTALRVLGSLAVVAAVLLFRPSPAAASTINCFLNINAPDRDASASPFISTLCAFPDNAATGGGSGAGGGGANSFAAARRHGSSSGGGSGSPFGAGSLGYSPAVSRSSGRAAGVGIGQGPGSPAAFSDVPPEDGPANDVSRTDDSGWQISGGEALRGSSSSDAPVVSPDFANVLVDDAWRRLVSDPVNPSSTVMPTTPFFEPTTETDVLAPVVAAASDAPANPPGAPLGATDVGALAVPEPGTFVLLGIGSIGLLATRRKNRGRRR